GIRLLALSAPLHQGGQRLRKVAGAGALMALQLWHPAAASFAERIPHLVDTRRERRYGRRQADDAPIARRLFRRHSVMLGWLGGCPPVQIRRSWAAHRADQRLLRVLPHTVSRRDETARATRCSRPGPGSWHPARRRGRRPPARICHALQLLRHAARGSYSRDE